MSQEDLDTSFIGLTLQGRTGLAQIRHLGTERTTVECLPCANLLGTSEDDKATALRECSVNTDKTLNPVG